MFLQQILNWSRLRFSKLHHIHGINIKSHSLYEFNLMLVCDCMTGALCCCSHWDSFSFFSLVVEDTDSMTWNRHCLLLQSSVRGFLMLQYIVLLSRFVRFVNVFHLMFWRSPFFCPHSQPLQVSPSGSVLKTSVTPPSRWSGVPLRGSAQLNLRVIVLSTARRAVSSAMSNQGKIKGLQDKTFYASFNMSYFTLMFLLYLMDYSQLQL